MLEIKGRLSKLKTVSKKAPPDRVHRVKTGGLIRHPRVMNINDSTLFYGNEAFYYRECEDIGIKVYYSIRLKKAWGRERITYISDKMLEFGELCAKPCGIIDVYINLRFAGQKIEKSVKGLMVEHVHYPKKAWKRFCLGYPYDWNAVDDRRHSPAGFLKFAEYAKEIVPALHVKSLNLGSVAWCCKKNQWKIIDVDWRKQ